MVLQIDFLIRCIVTLIAFVWLFASVRFQMRLQRTCIRGRKVAQFAFVWFFSTVCLQMCLQIAFNGRSKVTLITFVGFLSGKWSIRWIAWENSWLHWLHLWGFSAQCFFKMLLHIWCLWWCILTLVTFVWPFSNVPFQEFLLREVSVCGMDILIHHRSLSNWIIKNLNEKCRNRLWEFCLLYQK